MVSAVVAAASESCAVGLVPSVTVHFKFVVVVTVVDQGAEEESGNGST